MEAPIAMPMFQLLRPLRALSSVLLACAFLGAVGIPRSGRMAFRAYGSQEGLLHSSITTLAQDSAGFLWVGTEGGAYQFDGTTFRLWSLEEGLPAAWVRAFAPEPEGRLWIGTRAGLCLLDRDGRIHRLAADQVLAKARIHALLEDRGGRLWVASESGLFWEEGPGLFAPVPGWPGGPAFSLAQGPEGVWVGGTATVRRLDTSGAWSALGTREGVPPEPVKALLLDRAGTLWLRTPSTIRRLLAGTRTFGPLPGKLPPLAVSFYEESLVPDGGSGFFVPTAKGLLQVDATGQWRLIDASRGLPLGWANQALVDRDGNLWVASQGLHRLMGSASWENFTQLDGLPADNTWGILRDHAGVLWVDTSDGLARMGSKGPEPFPGAQGLVCYALTEAPDGSVWGGGEHPFLVRIDPGRTRIERIPLPASPSLWIPVALRWDGPDSLWIATSNAGLQHMVRRGVRWTFGPAAIPGLPPQGQVTAIQPDAHGRLWVAGEHGLARLDGTRWRTWGQDIGLKPAPVWAMATLPDGTAWIAYLEPMGLTHVDLNGEVPRVLGHLGRPQGLASDSVYSLASDAQGRLWVGGPRGVQRVDSRGLRLFKRADGLVGTDCNPFSTWVDPNGDIWFGTTTGLLHHIPGLGHAAVPLSAPLITSLRLGRLDWHRTIRGAWVLDDVPSSDRTLAVRFSSLAFEYEGRLRYQTRMIGLGEDWMDTDVREARYPALAPGSYRLEVRTLLDDDGAGPVTSVQFRILPPWWQRWWAWILWLGVLGVAAVASLRWRTGRLRRRTEELETLVRERTGALELSNLALTTISMTDALTGLRNRRYLAQELPPVLAVVQRLQRARLAGRIAESGPESCLVFALLDIDHFKRVNDTWGHAAGDRALQQIARILQREARESDFLVRWGGEEVLFVGHTADLDGAASVVTRLHQAVRDHSFDLETSAPHRLTCSIGFSLFPFQTEFPDGSPWEEQVRIADRCLYAAKHSGRDAWVGVAGHSGSALGLVARFEQDPREEIRRGAVDLRTSLAAEDLVWKALL